MKSLALVFFASISLFVPGFARSQEEKTVKKPASPQVLWLAYMKRGPSVNDLDNVLHGAYITVYREFAALEILRRGDYDMPMLKSMIVRRSESIKISAWEIFKKKATKDELRDALFELHSDACHHEDDDLCRATANIYAQKIVETLWTPERSQEDRLCILRYAPFAEDRGKAGEEVLENHPTDKALVDVLSFSPSRQQRDRVIDIIQSRKDFDRDALDYAFWRDDNGEGYLLIARETYVERFGDPNKSLVLPSKPPKSALLDLNDLDEMDNDQLLRLMGESDQ